MPDVLSPDPVMNLIYQSFARNVSMALSAHLRYDVGLSLDPAIPEESRELANPACLAVFRIQPGNIPLVLDVAPPLAKMIIELLLGGQPGDPAEEELSELTEIERHLLGEVLELIAIELTAAMARAGKFRVQVEGVETEREMLRVFPPSSQLVNLGLAVTTAAGSFRINVLQPPLFESNQGDAAPDIQADSAPPDAGFLDLLQAVEVDFEARLLGPQVALRELMALEPGDVIRLRHQTTQPLTGYVNGQSQFKGQIVASTRRRAFLVEN